MNSLFQLPVIEILLVEDSKSDAELTRRAFKASKLLNHLHIVRDGVQALDFLYQRHDYQQAPRPDLILLDLNLPKKNGREVLAEIKSDPTLRVIPVVILTTSEAEEDVLKSYELQANCYLTKPVDLERFIGVLKTIEQFWLSAVRLPPSMD